MTKLRWYESGTRLYEAGIDRGVLYPNEGPGVPWNGLVSVTEKSAGESLIKQYWDGQAYSRRQSNGTFEADIEAFTYPEELSVYENLTKLQSRSKKFGLCYRTPIGNDENPEHGYLLHLVYNALLEPVNRQSETINSDVDISLLAWNLTTTPFLIKEARASAHLVVDSTETFPEVMALIEDMLYGDELNEPRMPTPDEVYSAYMTMLLLTITDNGDGTWTAEGPDDMVYFTDDDTFVIDAPTVKYLDAVTYTVESI